MRASSAQPGWGSNDMVATTITPVRTSTGYFYVWMAGLCALIAFGGFAATYWLQLAAGTFVGPPILHVHGLIFSAWPLLLLSQTVRAANGRMEHHRAWGVFGVALATAMVILGLTVAIQGLTGRLAAGEGDAARAFMILPLGAIGIFAGLFIAAVLNVKRPEWHKRLILGATCGVLLAAMGRVGFLIATHGGGPGMRPGLSPPPPPIAATLDGVLMGLVLVVGVVHDWRTRGRPHPAYLVGIGALLTFAFVGPILAQTPGWYAAMDALAALGR
jgi:hypothetical protein